MLLLWNCLYKGHQTQCHHSNKSVALTTYTPQRLRWFHSLSDQSHAEKGGASSHPIRSLIKLATSSFKTPLNFEVLPTAFIRSIIIPSGWLTVAVIIVQVQWQRRRLCGSGWLLRVREEHGSHSTRCSSTRTTAQGIYWWFDNRERFSRDWGAH